MRHRIANTSDGSSSSSRINVVAQALGVRRVFGVELPDANQVSVTPVAVPLTAEGGPSPEQAAPLQTLAVPFQNRIPSRFRNVATTITPEQAASSACPAAPLGSAPAAQEPLNAAKPPAAGTYRYKISGSRTFRYTTGAVVGTPIQGFQPRVIRNVAVAGKKWTYDMLQPDGDGGVQITTWSVNTDVKGVSQAPPYVGENAIRVTEPDAGVSLQKIAYFDATGSSKQPFQPATPVTYLQLPVQIGAEFQSVGIDPRTGRTQAVQGQPTKRQTVDACGSLIDGWLVDLTITEARGVQPQEQRKEEVIISNDLGGVVISQRIIESGTLPDGTVVETDLTFSLGQITPSPLPEGSA